MSVEPDNKMKYIKLAKNTVIASILITLSLSLLEIPILEHLLELQMMKQVILHLLK